MQSLTTKDMTYTQVIVMNVTEDVKMSPLTNMKFIVTYPGVNITVMPTISAGTEVQICAVKSCTFSHDGKSVSLGEGAFISFTWDGRQWVDTIISTLNPAIPNPVNSTAVVKAIGEHVSASHPALLTDNLSVFDITQPLEPDKEGKINCPLNDSYEYLYVGGDGSLTTNIVLVRVTSEGFTFSPIIGELAEDCLSIDEETGFTCNITDTEGKFYKFRAIPKIEED